MTETPASPAAVAATSAAGSGTKFIVHPWVDVAAIGGLSIAFIVFLVVVDPVWNGPEVAQSFIILTALINWPHFMATYNMLYRSPQSVKLYPMATIWMPALLLVYCVLAVIAGPWTPIPAKLAAFASGAYLAWHYTGQTWGMMATFSHLAGKPFLDHEKKRLRIGLRILLAWHVIWFSYYLEPFGLKDLAPELATSVYSAATVAAGVGAGIFSVAGMVPYVRRVGRPPLRVMVPWIAQWLWYILILINPFAIFWVQISHGIQYLIFPARVEANRAHARGDRWPGWVRWPLYVGTIVGAGLAIFVGGPMVVAAIAGNPAAATATGVTAMSLGAFVNIHHYFADSVVWKISNPHVRRELFAHLSRDR